MKKKTDSVYLIHILDAITKIERYLEAVEKDIFFQDTLIQDGVIRQLEIIGEAVKNISNETKISFTQIPWQDIAGMRDKLIHHYFGVDIDQVWETAKKDIPFLKIEIHTVLESFE